MKGFLLTCYLFASVSVFGQTIKVLEKKLLKEFKKIDSSTPTGLYSSHNYSESGEQTNGEFVENFKHFIDKYPITISQSFTSFKNAGLGIVTSADGLFRIYCWDTGLGGNNKIMPTYFNTRPAT